VAEREERETGVSANPSPGREAGSPTGTPKTKTDPGVAAADGLPPAPGQQPVPTVEPASGGAPSDLTLERRTAQHQRQPTGHAEVGAQPLGSALAAAKAAALVAARAAGGTVRAQTAPATKASPAPIPLSAELQAFAQVVQAGVPGLQADALTVGLPAFRVARADLLAACSALRALSAGAMDYLACLSGVDYPEHIDVVYHLFSVARPGIGLVLKVAAPKAAGPDRAGADAAEVDPEALPWVPSVTSVWAGAQWHEREVFDLLGVRFLGNPDLRRILMPEGFSGGYPLRKDYVDRREQRVRKVRVR